MLALESRPNSHKLEGFLPVNYKCQPAFDWLDLSPRLDFGESGHLDLQIPLMAKTAPEQHTTRNDATEQRAAE